MLTIPRALCLPQTSSRLAGREGGGTLARLRFPVRTVRVDEPTAAEAG